MENADSLDKVLLLFPGDSLNSSILNIMKRKMPSPEMGLLDEKGDLKTDMAEIEALPEETVSEAKILGIKLGTLMKAFRGMKIEQIELSIKGAVETEGLLSIALSAKGEGGIKVVLKPGT